MLDYLDTAHPLLTLTTVVVVLLVLGAIQNLNRRLMVVKVRIGVMHRRHERAEEQMSEMARAAREENA